MSNSFHSKLTLDDIHSLIAATYADLTARDADTDFHGDSGNIDKLVRVDSPQAYYFLVSIVPEWDITAVDDWVELTDTPGVISAGLIVQGNSGGTALEFGQALSTTDSPTFAGLTVDTDTLFVDSSNNRVGIGTITPAQLLDLSASGSIGFAGSAILSDSAGTMTLSNVNALDATTETTIETAIDTLPNLTSASSLSTIGTITTGVWNGTDIAVTDGGTGSSTASGARTNLGLVIGTDVQAFSSDNAFRTDNLSVFAATTSSQFAGVISDETGSGSLVFATSPTIVTPTISSFTNASHDHSNALGGGQILSTSALSDTANIAYLNTSNVYSSGLIQDFGTSSIINVDDLAIDSQSSAVEGNVLRLDSSTGDGVYINFATSRTIGVKQGGDFFIGFNTYYDVVSNSYQGSITGNACIIEFDTSGDINFLTKSGVSVGVDYVPDIIMTIENSGDVFINGFEVDTHTDEIVVITTSAKFTDQATANIIAVIADQDLINRFQVTPISSTRFTVTGLNSNLRLVEDGFDNFVFYTGGGTLVTGTNAGRLLIESVGAVSSSGGRLFTWTGTNKGNDVSFVSLDQITLSGWQLGTIGRDSTSEIGPLVDIDTTSIVDWLDSLTLDGVIFSINKSIIDQPTGVSASKPVFIVENVAEKTAGATFRDLHGTLFSGETLVRIDAGIPDNQRVVLTGNIIDLSASLGMFDTTGSTGTFTVVADNSIAATAITGVTDSSGVASFTHSGTSPALGSKVTVSGFVTNTDYNSTGRVTATTATTFEIDYIAFGTTETGSYLVTGVTITSTAHGLTIDTGVTIDTTLSTDYDGGYHIYNIQTNSFDISATFTVTKAGSWSTEGLDQTDPRVIAIGNRSTSDSEVIGFGFTNGNSSATTVIDGTYGAIDASTFASNEITQRIKLIDSTSVIFELTALEDFQGFLTGSLSSVKSGSTENYRLSMSTNSVVPVFASANYIPIEVKTTSVNTALEFSVSLSTGDTIQIMVAGDGTSNSLTFTDLVLGIK